MSIKAVGVDTAFAACLIVAARGLEYIITHLSRHRDSLNPGTPRVGRGAPKLGE
jgi:hypothetical protein